MKRYTVVLSAAMLLTTITSCSANQSNKTETVANEQKPVSNIENETLVATNGGALPAFNMKDIAGNSVTLQSLKGKKVFVNLWASWCPPCRAEMPSIEKLYKSVDKDKVAFIMLSYDENPALAKQFTQKNNLSLPVYFPAEQPPAVFNVDGIPATFIFDEQGQIIKQNVGAEDYDTEAYRQLLK